MKARRRQQGGATLIEVLVSILVVSFGILGVVGSLGAAMMLQRSSTVQADAIRRAQSLGDIARSNKGGFSEGAFSWTVPYAAGGLPIASPCADATPCTHADAARSEFRRWLSAVQTELPEGGAYVDSRTAEGTLDVWLMWREGRGIVAMDSTQACPPAALTGLAAVARPSCVFVRIRV